MVWEVRVVPEFYGMKYPFKTCVRPALLKKQRCGDCSVRQFCEAKEKVTEKERTLGGKE